MDRVKQGWGEHSAVAGADDAVPLAALDVRTAAEQVAARKAEAAKASAPILEGYVA